ncbi:hypothetical protein EBB07_16340 [Paenibacillaceae bacterium]|nr:hypothetical protein EBB07_16340 [Paenibacillaceae bacterium]
MKSQHYGNHVRLIPAFHLILVPLSFLSLVVAIVYAFLPDRSATSWVPSLLFVFLCLMIVMAIFFSRRFACKVQDRAIRAEENLRHFVLTGKRLDSRLTLNQIIALRFASDDEFISLCEKAANEAISPEEIKRAINNWNADYDRA